MGSEIFATHHRFCFKNDFLLNRSKARNKEKLVKRQEWIGRIEYIQQKTGKICIVFENRYSHKLYLGIFYLFMDQSIDFCSNLSGILSVLDMSNLSIENIAILALCKTKPVFLLIQGKLWTRNDVTRPSLSWSSSYLLE